MHFFPADTETVQFTAKQGLTSKLILLFNFQLKNNRLAQKRELKNSLDFWIQTYNLNYIRF